MAIFKCKMCGGDLNLQEGVSVAECEYCGSVQTVPSADNEKKMTLFSRANRLRAGCEFDKAAGVYETIVADFPEEAEAYWGLVLCKYGIEYVDDPATGKKIPTCHRSSFSSVLEDSDFEQACENADAYARRIYRDEAKAIEELRKGIISVSANEKPYDIFICYKETAENGERTLDSVLAQDIYDALTGKGYRVFFSRITLEDKLGTEYEPYIFAALNSAKVMLAVGTDYEYYNAVWVKNEWSRYLKLMTQDKDKHLIPCFKGIDAYDMPKEFVRLQAQDMGRVGAMQDLLRGIEKLMGNTGMDTAVATAAAPAVNPTVDSLLRRAFMYLEDGEWEKADEYCEKVLDIDPENTQAYLGKLMAELHVRTQEALKDEKEPFDGNKNYQKALRFADDALRAELTTSIDHINTRNENTRLTSIYRRAKSAMAAAKTKQTKDAYLEAEKLFGSIRAFRDSAALEKSCREAAETARKDAIYAAAEAKMGLNTIEGYEKAIALFTSIPGWKHADENADICCGKIEELKAQAEQIRLAMAAQAKKTKKIRIITVVVAVLIAAAVLLTTKVIIPTVKYNAAVDLMEAGQYVDAIAAFEATDGYKDSAEQITECRYLTAVDLMEARQYVNAIAAFEAMDGYKDSTDQITECKYLYAATLLESEQLNQAMSLFSALGNYKDSIDQVSECQYRGATNQMQDKNWSTAASMFQSLGAYKDSAEQFAECKRLTSKNPQVGDYVLFGAYEQDNDTANGKEEIEWLVLDVQDGRALLISKYALDCAPYNTSYTKVTWETCTLRQWLNKDFLNAAFSTEEQTMIPTATVSADKNPSYSTAPGKATQDKVFLLSIQEANKYFASKSARQCASTDYAVANGAYVNSDNGNCCWWWLRSPGRRQDYAGSVISDGDVNERGVDYVIHDFGTVRPAIWVNIGE